MFIPDELEMFDGESIVTRKIQKDNMYNMKSSIQKTVNKILDFTTNNKFDHKTILTIIVNDITKYTKSKVGCFCLKTASKNNNFMLECIAKSKRCDTNFKKYMNGGNKPNLFICGVVNKKCIISSDISSDPRLQVIIPENHVKIKQFMAIPIFSNGMCMGQFVFINSHKFNKETIKKYSLLFYITSKLIKNYEMKSIYSNKNEIDNLKHSFLATMSHEIRTPLSGIVGMISLLSDAGPLNELQKNYLNRALTCCNQLMEIIVDILDYSKMKGGHLLLSDDSFNLKKCIDTAVDIINPKINEKELKFVFEVDELIPKILYGDSTRIKQVLINLLSNAVKFTNDGSVSLLVKLAKVVNKNEVLIKFIVKDTGIGIEKKDQNKIFDVFQQVESNTTVQKNSGTGLGLAITKELLSMMKSNIHVHSDGIGCGSSFSFEIKFQKEIIIDCENKHNINILVVDDNLDNRMVLSGYLHKWDIRYTTCSSAIEALHNLQLGNKYNIALVDVCMPRIDGIELAQTIRKEYQGMSIIALSSREVENDGRMWFDVVMTKPFNKMRLYDHIIRLSSNECSNPNSLNLNNCENVNSKKCVNELKICIAENDEMNQVVLNEMLKRLGVEEKNIKVCVNGEMAVNLLKCNYYDVCLMDLRMPVMDGIEASKIIKKLKNHPSIVIVSASILDSDKVECSKIGVDAYLSKPYILEDLKNVIDQYITS